MSRVNSMCLWGGPPFYYLSHLMGAFSNILHLPNMTSLCAVVHLNDPDVSVSYLLIL